MTSARSLAPARPAVPSVRKDYGRIPEIISVPNLIQVQLDSFQWFIGGPDTAGRMERACASCSKRFADCGLHRDAHGAALSRYEFGEPKYTELECREKDMTYSAPLANGNVYALYLVGVLLPYPRREATGPGAVRRQQGPQRRRGRGLFRHDRRRAGRHHSRHSIVRAEPGILHGDPQRAAVGHRAEIRTRRSCAR